MTVPIGGGPVAPGPEFYKLMNDMSQAEGRARAQGKVQGYGYSTGSEPSAGSMLGEMAKAVANGFVEDLKSIPHVVPLAMSGFDFNDPTASEEEREARKRGLANVASLAIGAGAPGLAGKLLVRAPAALAFLKNAMLMNVGINVAGNVAYEQIAREEGERDLLGAAGAGAVFGVGFGLLGKGISKLRKGKGYQPKGHKPGEPGALEEGISPEDVAGVPPEKAGPKPPNQPPVGGVAARARELRQAVGDPDEPGITEQERFIRNQVWGDEASEVRTEARAQVFEDDFEKFFGQETLPGQKLKVAVGDEPSSVVAEASRPGKMTTRHKDALTFIRMKRTEAKVKSLEEQADWNRKVFGKTHSGHLTEDEAAATAVKLGWKDPGKAVVTTGAPAAGAAPADPVTEIVNALAKLLRGMTNEEPSPRVSKGETNRRRGQAKATEKTPAEAVETAATAATTTTVPAKPAAKSRKDLVTEERAKNAWDALPEGVADKKGNFPYGTKLWFHNAEKRLAAETKQWKTAIASKTASPEAIKRLGESVKKLEKELTDARRDKGIEFYTPPPEGKATMKPTPGMDPERRVVATAGNEAYVSTGPRDVKSLGGFIGTFVKTKEGEFPTLDRILANPKGGQWKVGDDTLAEVVDRQLGRLLWQMYQDGVRTIKVNLNDPGAVEAMVRMDERLGKVAKQAGKADTYTIKDAAGELPDLWQIGKGQVKKGRKGRLEKRASKILRQAEGPTTTPAPAPMSEQRHMPDTPKGRFQQIWDEVISHKGKRFNPNDPDTWGPWLKNHQKEVAEDFSKTFGRQMSRMEWAEHVGALKNTIKSEVATEDGWTHWMDTANPIPDPPSPNLKGSAPGAPEPIGYDALASSVHKEIQESLDKGLTLEQVRTNAKTELKNAEQAGNEVATARALAKLRRIGEIKEGKPLPEKRGAAGGRAKARKRAVAEPARAPGVGLSASPVVASGGTAAESAGGARAVETPTGITLIPASTVSRVDNMLKTFRTGELWNKLLMDLRSAKDPGDVASIENQMAYLKSIIQKEE